MVAVQPWWFVFLFCSYASHSYFWGSSVLWLRPSDSPASRMAELHAGVQRWQGGRLRTQAGFAIQRMHSLGRERIRGAKQL